MLSGLRGTRTVFFKHPSPRTTTTPFRSEREREQKCPARLYTVYMHILELPHIHKYHFNPQPFSFSPLKTSLAFTCGPSLSRYPRRIAFIHTQFYNYVFPSRRRLLLLQLYIDARMPVRYQLLDFAANHHFTRF